MFVVILDLISLVSMLFAGNRKITLIDTSNHMTAADEQKTIDDSIITFIFSHLKIGEWLSLLFVMLLEIYFILWMISD